MERPYAYIKKWLLTDIFSDRYGPIPKIYVKAISTRLSRGKSTPAIRAIQSAPPYPCFCLCLGFSQITIT